MTTTSQTVRITTARASFDRAKAHAALAQEKGIPSYYPAHLRGLAPAWQTDNPVERDEWQTAEMEAIAAGVSLLVALLDHSASGWVVAPYTAPDDRLNFKTPAHAWGIATPAFFRDETPAGEVLVSARAFDPDDLATCMMRSHAVSLQTGSLVDLFRGFVVIGARP